MKNIQIPPLSEQQIHDGLLLANNSLRQRHPIILHSPGDEFNRVLNFIMQDSYMQPHLHPGIEKIEKIYLIKGKLAIFYFNDQGEVKKCTILREGGQKMIEVPAFTWHTYVMLSEYVITYETMLGVYDPINWKELAEFAPHENSCESNTYLTILKEEACTKINEEDVEA